MPEKLHTILSIAGSDPMGGAGIQSDIRAGNELGLHVLTAITAVTSQNSKGVSSLGLQSPECLRNQLDSIIEDCSPDAIKIGMIGNVESLYVIIDFLNSLDHKVPIVVDPILNSTRGNAKLIQNDSLISEYINSLFPISTVVTPNTNELCKFINKGIVDYNNLKELPYLLNTNALILKGGHTEKEIIKDILIEKDKAPVYSQHSRVNISNLHGTGCAFASFLASYLALGMGLEDAFTSTSAKIFDIIFKSRGYSLGSSAYGPLNINNYFI